MSSRRDGTIKPGYGSVFSSEDLPFLAVLSGAIGSLMFITLLFVTMSSSQIIPFGVPESMLSDVNVNYSMEHLTSSGMASDNINYSILHSISDERASYEWGIKTPLPSGILEEDLKIFPRYVFPRGGVSTYVLTSARYNTTYSVILSAKGGQEPYKWQVVEGTLPPGISMNTSGMLYGTPVKEGLYNFTVMVTDAEGNSGVQRAELTVFSDDGSLLRLTTDSLPDAIKGRHYQIALAATGGTGRYNWSTRGELPPGLNFSAGNGKFNGTPESTGVWCFEVTVEDEQSLRFTRLLSISVKMGRQTP